MAKLVKTLVESRFEWFAGESITNGEFVFLVGVSGIKLVSNVSNERLWLGLLDKGESSVESWHNLTISSLLRERKVFDLVIIAHFRLINSNTVTIKIDSFEKPSLSRLSIM